MSDIYKWYKAIAEDELDDGRMYECIVGEKRIGILKRGIQIFAFSATCPHAGAPLCEGWLDVQGRIICPLHKYRFDPANGRNVTGEGYKLKTYPIEIREGYIYIGLLL